MTKQKVKIGLAIASLCIISLYVIYTFLKPQVNYADLSPYALLDALDVQLAVQQSLRENAPQQLDKQIKQIVSVAKKMPLPPADIRFLRSDDAKDYLVFHGKRALFDELVSEQFKTLGTISELKQRFPEAKDKFKKADEILSQRDVLFEQIVTGFIDQGFTHQQAQAQARAEWYNRFKLDVVK